MKKMILCFTLLFSSNIFSLENEILDAQPEGANFVSEYTGTVSIAPKYSWRTQCHKEGEGFFRTSPVVKNERYGTTYPQPYLGYINGLPVELSEYYKNENAKSKSLDYLYSVMPKYMVPKFDPQNQFFIFVKITLNDGKNFFRKTTYCYLPLTLFRVEGYPFKHANNKVEFIIRFKDYKDETKNYKFTLTLDYTFDALRDLYEAYQEDEGRHVAIKTRNCLTRVFKRFAKSANNLRERWLHGNGQWQQVDADDAQ